MAISKGNAQGVYALRPPYLGLDDVLELTQSIVSVEYQEVGKMPAPAHLDFDDAARQALCDLRDHAPKAYLRERAAVLLAIGAGRSMRSAGRDAGLKPHHIETICHWVARYRAEGIAGLTIRKGRGRKPASFPVGFRRRPGAGSHGDRSTARRVGGE